MQSQEAGQLLVLMQATWPKIAADDVAARLWVEDLMGLDAAVAYTTFRELRAACKYSPSFAEFREAYLAVYVRNPPERPAIEAEQWVPPTPEKVESVRGMIRRLAQGMRSE
jgi:hypothetical protein